MVDLFCVPRINALGLKGPEKSCENILKGQEYTRMETLNEEIDVDEDIIYEISREALKEKCFFVGGDHSITFPIGKAFLKNFGRSDSFLIVFDAHADCMPSMAEPTHEEIIYGLVEKGWNPKNIAIVGVRKIEPEELGFLKEKKISYFNAKEMKDDVFNAVRKKALGRKVYLSVDIDALDPKIAPGVNYPEKGGLSEDDFFYLFEKMSIELDVRAYDLVEIVKKKDKGGKTMELGKKILDFVINLN